MEAYDSPQCDVCGEPTPRQELTARKDLLICPQCANPRVVRDPAAESSAQAEAEEARPSEFTWKFRLG